MQLFWMVIAAALVWCAQPALAQVQAEIDKQEYLAGDTVTISGKIEPGKDLYIAISSQRKFAPNEAGGVNEIKSLNAAVEENAFEADTSVPVLYYMLTNNPDKFGAVEKKRFGGPSFARGIYSTTMFELANWQELDEEAKSMLGPLKSPEEWAFYKYNHENGYGINTITKERTQVGKVTIFARSVLTDYEKNNNYWDEGTTIDLDKSTGEFTASFASFRHTPPDTSFDVVVNGEMDAVSRPTEPNLLVVVVVHPVSRERRGLRPRTTDVFDRRPRRRRNSRQRHSDGGA
ncbi:MAG: hypothetical protein R6U41_05470 [Desulfosalsimonas sp.]|uniref:hypothetical protein n=1 Tax=Desulfosalsimonas sp. TaxID=3073848 RepID=UPI0039707293